MARRFLGNVSSELGASWAQPFGGLDFTAVPTKPQSVLGTVTCASTLPMPRGRDETAWAKDQSDNESAPSEPSISASRAGVWPLEH